jgi:hypothetical protein
MQDKPMLIFTIILTGMLCIYFWIFGFSTNKYTRIGQYGGLGMAIFIIIDDIFRP